MRIFVAGATGVIGSRLVPLLVRGGHEVWGMTRTPAKRPLVDRQGARSVVADALDPEAVGRAVREAQPDVVVHQLTALSDLGNMRNFEKAFAQNMRMRSEGTDNLLSASRAAGVGRFVAQSFAGYLLAPGNGPVTEEDALVAEPPKVLRRAFAADRHLEAAVTGAEWTQGIVLRYGMFYGPGTSLSMSPPGVHTELVRKRQFPIVGGGTGVWSFVHIDDASAATVAAIERGRRGLYHIVDDEPARVAEFLPALAQAIGAPRPLRVPKWLGRLLGGAATAIMTTEARGASNAKAKRELGWEPRWKSWRDGFAHGLG
jgi:nucleoside-diphosphate-sugar epimerase